MLQPPNLPPVSSGSGNLLRQSDCTPICLTISRRRLSDLREWQLLKLLKIHPIHRVAVIGEGTLGAKRYQQKFPGRHYEFTAWHPVGVTVSGGSALADWFNWWQKLPANSTFDAVIWQVGPHERNFWGERDYWRLLGGAIDLMQKRFSGLKIFLLLPEKAAPADRKNFGRFAREYGLDLL